MVRRIENWPWSSYLATCGQVAKPEWLQCDFILSLFSTRRSHAVAKYIAFVQEGRGLPCVWDKLTGQIYLGSEAFIEKMQALVEKRPMLNEIPRIQRRALSQSLAAFAQQHERNDAIALAYLSGQHTMTAIADHFRVHYTTVSRLVKAYETAK